MRPYIRKKNFIMKMITKAHVGRQRDEQIKFKFGVQVPNNYLHAVKLDRTNGDKGWDASVDTEMVKIKVMETFKDHGHKEP